MKKLIVISAPSGAGKTTLCRRLLQDFPEMTLSISTTTRLPRGEEREGRDYFFITRAEFEARIQAGRFAEWALVHGNYYGTSKDVLGRAFASKSPVLLDIDVQGAASLRKSYPDECFSVFVSPPDIAVLESRLRARGTDTEESIQRRIRNAREELTEAPLFDKIILNDDLDRAYLELKLDVAAQTGGIRG